MGESLEYLVIFEKNENSSFKGETNTVSRGNLDLKQKKNICL